MINEDLLKEAGKVWKIVWPIILTNILNVTVGIIDFKMVGVLGVNEIAAVGVSRQVINLLMVLMLAISGGTSVLIGRAYGAKDQEKISLIAAKSVTFMLLSAFLLITPLGYFFSEDILQILGSAPEIISLGKSYLEIIFLGTVFTMFNFAVNGILLGLGKTKVSLKLLIVVNILNMLFNYVFIFGMGFIPSLGVKGAALGTIMARFIGTLIGIDILIKPKYLVALKFKYLLKFDFELLKKILYLGGPRSLQGIVRNFSRLMILRIIALLPNSTKIISAYSLSMQVRMISTFIGLAFMSASLARVSQNIGAKELDKAEKSGWLAALMAALLMTVIALIFLVFPEKIISFFTDDREVISFGRTFFIIVAFSEPVMAFAFALGGALRGGGDSLTPFKYSALSDLVIVIITGYLLAVKLEMGLLGIALAFTISAITRAVPVAIVYKKGYWKSKKL